MISNTDSAMRHLSVKDPFSVGGVDTTTASSETSVVAITEARSVSQASSDDIPRLHRTISLLMARLRDRDLGSSGPWLEDEESIAPPSYSEVC